MLWQARCVADVLDPRWVGWRERRVHPRGIHADTSAAGRCSKATLTAIADHLRLEAEIGAYIAQATAAPVLDQLRATVADLLGMSADGVAFVESASAALRALLAAWPLEPDGAVAVAPSEWGTNLAIFDERGLRPTLLATDAVGVIDLDALSRMLRSRPPALVHVTQVAAHRGLVQPVADIADACRAAGVPVWVDAAQALGHVDVDCGADAVYATARKWLCGPRGVGLLAVNERWWPSLRVRHHVLAPSDEPIVRALESDDAHVAGRVGLAVAVRELLDDGLDAVSARLTEVGDLTRTALAELTGWSVVPANGSAITSIEPRAGQEVSQVRRRLLERHGILTTASLTERSPLDAVGPSLRISPHVDWSAVQRDALLAALYTEG